MKKPIRPEIPRKTIYRLSIYLRCLQRLKSNAIRTVSSDALAKAAGLVVAVLTNDMRAFHGDAWIARMTILGEMDLVVDGSVEHVLKPDPRIYRLATERLGVEPEDCLFVDDQPGNVEGARAVGMAAIWFDVTAPERSYAQVLAALAATDDAPGGASV